MRGSKIEGEELGRVAARNLLHVQLSFSVKKKKKERRKRKRQARRKSKGV